ncbi:vWA domain-containing protein [Sagittula salina]|uniref:VWA domain-containing protein n=1 Tax=Sagittula salina TaxID=2820268 RepID=A0A940S358_9RHOB|nr:VWA domain-containing protein [Sagittula salina]MBP0484772.1 VWA domain-containing protein [Sagittula salina]
MTLLRPEWLLALPVLAAFGWAMLRRELGLGDWVKAADPRLLRALAAMGQVEGDRRDTGPLAVLAAAGLVVLGLAGPAVERRDAVSFRNLDAAILVLDASTSATESPDWTQIVAMGRHGLSTLGTRPGGLVVYAGDAYVASDVTGDLRQLGQTLSLVDAETVPDPGSRPERGLALALSLLEQAQVLQGDVILFSDGAGVGPEALSLAARIADRGARLSVVPMGGADLETLAQLGQGHVFSPEDTTAFAAFLADEGRAQRMAQDYPLLYWRDLGRWLLALALVPLLWLFRRAQP